MACGMSLDEAVDIPDALALKIIRANTRRKKMEFEAVANMTANAVGKMLFGEKKEGGSPDTSPGHRGPVPQGKGKPGAFWRGGETHQKPNLKPDPSRPRLRELAAMEPRQMTDRDLAALAGIRQSGIPR